MSIVDLDHLLDTLSAGLTGTAGDDRIPFDVIHGWYAHTIVPMLQEEIAERGAVADAYETVRRLHLRALAGEVTGEAEWRDALEAMLRDVYRRAYPTDELYAEARGKAHAHAIATGRVQEAAIEFADEVARWTTDIDAQCFAEANAIANARAAAAAYASADHRAYVETFPSARLTAYVNACANQVAPNHRAAARREFRGRLAGGLADLVGRAADPENGLRRQHR